MCVKSIAFAALRSSRVSEMSLRSGSVLGNLEASLRLLPLSRGNIYFTRESLTTERLTKVLVTSCTMCTSRERTEKNISDRRYSTTATSGL